MVLGNNGEKGRRGSDTDLPSEVGLVEKELALWDICTHICGGSRQLCDGLLYTSVRVRLRLLAVAGQGA